MKPLRRVRPIRILALLIGTGFIALWVRSHFSNDLIVFTTPRRHYVELAAIPDQFRITIVDRWPGRVPITFTADTTRGLFWPIFGQGPIYHRWFPLGFAVTRGSRSVLLSNAGFGATWIPLTYSQWAIPFPLPVSLCMAVAFWPLFVRLLRRRREATRASRGFCSQCGYDLRATPGRCPECGAERDSRLTPVP